MKFCLLALLLLLACSGEKSSEVNKEPISYKKPPKDTPQALAIDEKISQQPPLLIQGATLLTATGREPMVADLRVDAGRITTIGQGLEVKGAILIDGRGKYLTPGLIDTHSHLGVYPIPGVQAHSDGNEAVKAQTAGVWAEHSFWPQDPGLWRALAGGVTSIQVLPGSANLIGGRSVTVRTEARGSVTQMKFPGAPQGLKMACGENPKRVYGSKGGPSTRMGNFAGYRRYFQEAYEYGEKWRRYERDLAHWQESVSKEQTDPPTAPKRNHDYDTLVAAMKGDILVHVHCYRADEMSAILDLAKDYGFKVRSFHHGSEAYKIADRLAKEGVSVSTWADWWGFKMEAFDGIPYNAAIVHQKGGRAIIHSDSPEDIRFLNIEAAKARKAGERLGLKFSDDDVLRWITANPAWALGIDQQVGTLEKGKLADLVLWDGHPFSAYSKVEKTILAGRVAFDRLQGTYPASDFERGLRVDLSDQQVTAGQSPEFLSDTDSLATSLPQLSGSFIIDNARLLTSTGLSEVKSIWVEAGKIKRVGEVPKNADQKLKRFDAGERILSAGLIESQSNVGTVLIPMEHQAKDNRAPKHISPAFTLKDSYDPFSIRVPIARQQGVSSMILKPSGGIISGQGISVDLRGGMEAVSAYKSYLFASVFDSKSNRGEFWLKLREIFDDARYLQRQLKGRRLPNLNLALKPIHLKAINKVLRGKMPLVLEVSRLSDIHAALRLHEEIRAGGEPLRLILSGAEEAWMARRELAASGIPVIISPTKQLPWTLNQLRVRDDLAKLLIDAGVKTIFSANDSKVGRLRQQAGRAVAYGVSHSQAMAAITEVPARVFGLKDRGRIAKGLRADLVLWDGDPLQASSKAVAMWIAGESQSLETRQDELAKAYSPSQMAH